MAKLTKYPPAPGQYYPDDEIFAKSDIIEKITLGHVPAEPTINKKTNIVAFGSCFAAYVSRYLKDSGYNVASRSDANMAYIATMGDWFVNTFSILQQFEWAWLGKQPTIDLWYGYDARTLGYRDEVRVETKKLLDETDVFILTLGLSEIWYDEPTGQVFWRMVPTKYIDSSRHKFRVASYTENLANLHSIVSLIREKRPSAQIIFTLSPVPLRMTFRNISCITANEASKAILRSAIDEMMRGINDDHVCYFPSFEIVRYCFYRPFILDRRHVNEYIINFVMSVFDYYFCGGISKEEMFRRFDVARERDLGWVNGNRFYDFDSETPNYDLRQKL